MSKQRSQRDGDLRFLNGRRGRSGACCWLCGYGHPCTQKQEATRRDRQLTQKELARVEAMTEIFKEHHRRGVI